LENNLFGCDIDKRAATLANFAITMKARQYYKRFFTKSITPNIVELKEYGNDEFKGIKNYGSLMKLAITENFEDGIFAQVNREYELQKKILGSEFTCVVTNPPYMGGKGMNSELGDFVKSRYPDSKSDLFAVFMERGLEITKDLGYMAMITMQSWMFLSSYEKLREKIIKNHKIDSLVDMGWHAFGNPSYPSVAFVLEKK
jgi:type II restriction/modification system DNA methylase subunit YeeA